MRRELDRLKDRREEFVGQLIALAQINSGSYNRAGVGAVAQALMPHFAALGAEVRLVELEPLRRLCADGSQERLSAGPLLHARCRPQAATQVFLGGHLDTVFAADHPFQQVDRVDPDRLHGPGVADLKGGLLVMLAALGLLEADPDASRLGWEVVLNPEEEIGSPVSAPYLAERAANCDLGLVYEPALPGGILAAGRNGSGNFQVLFSGRSAHSGRDHAAGRNAIRALSDFVACIDDLNGQREGVTLNAATVHGGGVLNRVPDRAQLEFNARVPDAASIEWLEQRLAEAIALVNGRDGLSAELLGGFHRPPKPRDAAMQTLYGWLGSCADELGIALDWADTGGCCDGNNLAAAGLPNLDTLGVVGGGIHSDAEWMQISSIAERAALSGRLLRGLARGEFEPGELTEAG